MGRDRRSLELRARLAELELTIARVAPETGRRPSKSGAPLRGRGFRTRRCESGGGPNGFTAMTPGALPREITVRHVHRAGIPG
ncbi:hypothetical protein [Mycolicibacterium moriokaense]|uniref:hypothetical protein n=1 Tax=Mycolicibacterium moriokaense TaxID=39691 RepID=UPI0011B8230C|nr:hypothetical protein [Mycolicibacterium moriokaense]